MRLKLSNKLQNLAVFGFGGLVHLNVKITSFLLFLWSLDMGGSGGVKFVHGL